MWRCSMVFEISTKVLFSRVCFIEYVIWDPYVFWGTRVLKSTGLYSGVPGYKLICTAGVPGY